MMVNVSTKACSGFIDCIVSIVQGKAPRHFRLMVAGSWSLVPGTVVLGLWHDTMMIHAAPRRLRPVPKGKKEKESWTTEHETSGGFGSIREAYEEIGASAYYELHGSDYRNPHEGLLVEALSLELSALEEATMLDASSAPLRILDLACGSGEASIAMRQWAAARVDHKDPVLVAADPYTHVAYEARLGLPCESWSFEDVYTEATTRESEASLLCSRTYRLAC
eukprot:gnl/TRDRNA2_/TRDRNA2_160620_c0_seq3.p1 gnl/TRDRNA2_/TRDRNA2_160620_c0~~gnl/TRDRNA2_/TRDRNA2_160620_c0_seq3.p1  ORF type:complete len:222 (-),score=30.52 gnl/TRDRNA2_/TRDRNA2_160620_c0_seq3:312-977(-)